MLAVYSDGIKTDVGEETDVARGPSQVKSRLRRLLRLRCSIERRLSHRGDEIYLSPREDLAAVPSPASQPDPMS